jgi:hypothetical protein
LLLLWLATLLPLRCNAVCGVPSEAALLLRATATAAS